MPLSTTYATGDPNPAAALDATNTQVNGNAASIALNTTAVSKAQYSLKPSSVTRQTIAREVATLTNNAFIATGKASAVAIGLFAGDVVTNVTFMAGSTGITTGTHYWFFLADSSYNVLAISADQTTASWLATTAKTIAMGSPYTVPTTGVYYIGLMVAATTVPNILAVANNTTAVNALSPLVSWQDNTNTGLTTPVAVGFTFTPTVAASTPWAAVS